MSVNNYNFLVSLWEIMSPTSPIELDIWEINIKKCLVEITFKEQDIKWKSLSVYEYIVLSYDLA